MGNSSRILFPVLLLLVAAVAQAAKAPDRQAALAALGEQRYAEAADIWAAIVAQAPDDGEAHYRLGTALMALDRLAPAARHFKLAAEHGFQAQGAGYRLARIHARQGNNAAALDGLETLAASGFGLFSLIETEDDFAAVRDDARFVAAVSAMKANRYPCRSSEQSRAFDFWVGRWDVSAGGQQAGTNDVRLILGDCVLFENWQSVTGSSGKSFNFYNAAEDHWRQVWVDDRGGVIEFTGRVTDGVMYYTAETRVAGQEQPLMHKLTFSRNEDGSVRQHWEQSGDGGDTWQTVFDGHYVRAANESG